MCKKKKILLICLGVIALVMLVHIIWIHLPSEASIVYYDPDSDVTIRDELSYEETVQVKRILFGKIRWPEWLYGYPACGFGSIFAVILDGKYYMPSWDSCGMLAVMDEGADHSCTYINITQRQKQIIQDLIRSRSDPS